ncbi:MAG: ABC transporter permease [Acidobacteria bacterium]|nr:ABC transporter permease [Acidobacteriota bacterium]MBV9144335.1 ABC transporter permease [Acidobacteriota bacterium]MBV9435558.1 ABC transporter permease [Acidobacteriota bacterium]
MQRWIECLRLAFSALKADKLKAFLTTLSVLIGSASLVLVVTIAGTGKRYIVSRIEGIGANLAYASLNRNGSPVEPQDELTLADLNAIRNNIPGIQAVAGTYDAPVDFQISGRPRHARLVGATPEFLQIRNLHITAGRYFDEMDFRSHSKVCLVTDAIVQRNPTLALGDSLRIDQFRCTVIGTFTEGVPTFGQSEIQSESVLVPYPIARLITGEAFLQVIYAQAASPGEVPALTREIRHVLQSRHRREARYDVDNLSSLLETAGDISLAMTAVLLAIGLVTLIVGGTGIMNIMLANIAERKHEIGLRKALGARASEIRLQFLLEAVFISSAGSLAGAFAAVLLLGSAALFVKDFVNLNVSWESVAFALVVSSAIGLMFGYQPASRAASLNPVEALRTEA